MKFSMCMYAHVTDITPVSNCSILALFLNLPLFATHFTRQFNYTLNIEFCAFSLIMLFSSRMDYYENIFKCKSKLDLHNIIRSWFDDILSNVCDKCGVKGVVFIMLAKIQ